jgi:ribosomal protein S27AE
MNIYDFVSGVCRKRTLDVNTAAVQRLVGTLRCAGFSDDIVTTEQALAETMLVDRLRHLDDPTLHVASDLSSSISPIPSTAKFEEIDTLRSKNMCPRCKKSMEMVKLANYEKAAYCTSCKVALWTD